MTARELARTGARVVMACRNEEKGRKALRAAGGLYIGPDGVAEGRGHPTRVSPSKAARDESVARMLWEVSEEMTGVKIAPAVPA